MVLGDVANHRLQTDHPNIFTAVSFCFLRWGGQEGAAGMGEDLPQYSAILKHFLINRVCKRNIQLRERAKEAQLKYMLFLIFDNLFVPWIYNKSLLLQIY